MVIWSLLGAGPGSDDSYADLRSDYQKNEVAVDYNAGFTGVNLFWSLGRFADVINIGHLEQSACSGFLALRTGVSPQNDINDELQELWLSWRSQQTQLKIALLAETWFTR